MEMKADIESDRTETMQFHKIYIQRHENVRFVTLSAALGKRQLWSFGQEKIKFCKLSQLNGVDM